MTGPATGPLTGPATGPARDLSTAPLDKRFVMANGRRMAYATLGISNPSGTGDPSDASNPSGMRNPIVFLHGNPTSSYLWRNVMPHLADQGTCLAPDLIGMGSSEKLADCGPDSYRLVEHRAYLDAWFEAVLRSDESGAVVLVVHDWGSALGFDWARRHPDRVRGIAYMEGIVRPLIWSEWNEQARGIFQGFRSDKGEAMVLERNMFVERVLPGSVLRALRDAEMAIYRQPFMQPGEDRRPTLSWPRQIPIDGEPADVVAIVRDYADWLSHSDIPKLFINAEPGAILTGPQRDFCRRWPNQTEITVRGSHFIQEDSPHEIGAAISEWLTGLP